MQDFQKQLEKQFVEHLHSTTEINNAVMQLLVRDNYLIDELMKNKLISCIFILLLLIFYLMCAIAFGANFYAYWDKV